MKVTQSGSPRFNAKAPGKKLVSINCNNRQWDVEVQNLKELAEGPVLFVLNQDGNGWAYDFINAFKSAYTEWSADGSFPEHDHILMNESRGDLQSKLYEHPFIQGFSRKPARIITVGDAASAEVARYRVAWGLTSCIQQLFCVIGDPETLDLVDMNGQLLANTNGVYAVEARSLTKQIRSLRSLSRVVKTVSIISGYSGRFDSIALQKDKAAQKIIQECEKFGMRALRVYIVGDESIADYLEGFGSVCEAVITLRDDAVYGHLDEIASFCTKNRIIHFASELSSVARGAAIGFGNAPAAYVPSLMNLMWQHKETHLPLNSFELEIVEEPIEVRHNMSSIRAQVRDLTEEKEDLLEMTSIHAVY
ncbi:MAG: hypothetical protein QG632_721 [Candidatus Dependentiae bacterium]|nr:hypothetical protein [Candidatus Dependentiae bacterium]